MDFTISPQGILAPSDLKFANHATQIEKSVLVWELTVGSAVLHIMAIIYQRVPVQAVLLERRKVAEQNSRVGYAAPKGSVAFSKGLRSLVGPLCQSRTTFPLVFDQLCTSYPAHNETRKWNGEAAQAPWQAPFQNHACFY